MQENVLVAQDLVRLYIANTIMEHPDVDQVTLANSELLIINHSYCSKKEYYDQVMNFGRDLAKNSSPLAKVINQLEFSFSDGVFEVDQDLMINEITNTWIAIGLPSASYVAEYMNELIDLLQESEAFHSA